MIVNKDDNNLCSPQEQPHREEQCRATQSLPGAWCFTDGADLFSNLYQVETRKKIKKCICKYPYCKDLRALFKQKNDSKRNVSIRVRKISNADPKIVNEAKRKFRDLLSNVFRCRIHDNECLTIEAWHFHPFLLKDENNGPYSFIVDEAVASYIYRSPQQCEMFQVRCGIGCADGLWFVMPCYSYEDAVRDSTKNTLTSRCLEFASRNEIVRNGNTAAKEHDNIYSNHDLQEKQPTNQNASSPFNINMQLMTTMEQIIPETEQEECDSIHSENDCFDQHSGPNIIENDDDDLVNENHLQSTIKDLITSISCQYGSRKTGFYSNDPYKSYSSHPSRMRLFNSVVYELLDIVGAAIMPNVAPREKRLKIMHTILGEKIGIEEEEDEESILKEVGAELIHVLKQKETSKQRRQLMSIVCGSVKRDEMVRLLSNDTDHKIPSQREWKLAKKHRIYPGVGQPVIKRMRNRLEKKCNEAVIDNFLSWCHSAGMIQNVAFGQKICRYSNGKYTVIPSVKITMTVGSLIKQYYGQYLKQVHSCYDSEDDDMSMVTIDNIAMNDNGCIDQDSSSDNSNELTDDDLSSCCTDMSDDESKNSLNISIGDNGRISKSSAGDQSLAQRCTAICRKSNLCCLKMKGHLGRHKFTPQGYPSPSFIEKVLSKLTDGTIKSLAGLDNTHVIKGHENFLKMHTLVDNMASFLREMRSDLDFEQKVKNIHSNIENSTLFYKREFSEHLNLSLIDIPGSPCCTCMKCGMHSDQHPVECSLRGKSFEDGGHSLPCEQCQRSFENIMDMYDLHDEVRLAVEAFMPKYHNSIILDDVETWREEIDEVQNNLRDFRAHICQKEDEAIYERHSLRSMKNYEVMVISDYKMKILPAQFREPQKNYFGKRGFSCLGFMVIYPSRSLSERGEKVTVEYHFMFSNDTTQDAHAVICAKTALYSLLEMHGIKRVHFRADGAGCFNGNVAKAALPHWPDVAKVIEKSYKISVAGCGKSNLDGMFGILTQHLQRLVNAGYDYSTAEDTVKLLSKYPLRASYFHLFSPDRSFLHQTTASNLSDYYLLEYVEGDEPYVIGKVHSRHGSGQIHKIQDLTFIRHSFNNDEENNKETMPKSLTEICTTMNEIDINVGQSCAIISPSNHNDDDDHTSTHGKVNYSLQYSVGNKLENNKMKNSTDTSWHSYIVESTWVNNTKKSMTHNLMASQERQQRQINDRVGRANASWMKSKNDEHNAMIEAGLFCCSAKNKYGEYCTKRYVLHHNLVKHIKSEMHVFPKNTTSIDVMIDQMVTWTLPCGKSDDSSKITNLCRVVNDLGLKPCNSEHEIRQHKDVHTTWFKPGCYNKIQGRSTRKRAPKFSTALKLDLEMMFCEGEKKETRGCKPNASKYTPEEAQAALRNMIEGGRRKYSPCSENGPVPSVARIRQWFSGRSRGTIEPFTSDSDPYNKLTKDELIACCLEKHLSYKGKLSIIKMLENFDTISGLNSSYADYNTKTITELERICKERGLPEKKETREMLKHILRLHDECIARVSHNMN